MKRSELKPGMAVAYRTPGRHNELDRPRYCVVLDLDRVAVERPRHGEDRRTLTAFDFLDESGSPQTVWAAVKDRPDYMTKTTALVSPVKHRHGSTGEVQDVPLSHLLGPWAESLAKWEDQQEQRSLNALQRARDEAAMQARVDEVNAELALLGDPAINVSVDRWGDCSIKLSSLERILGVNQ